MLLPRPILCAFALLCLQISCSNSHYWLKREDELPKEVRDSILGLREEARKITQLEKESGFFDRVAIERLFKRFTLHFKRPYVSDESEYQERLGIFIRRLKKQAELNREEKKHRFGANFGINKFSDWTEDEFKALLKSQPMSKDAKKLIKFTGSEGFQQLKKGENGDCTYKLIPPPKFVDWRKENTITGVKNQGNCGSCWAFVATEQTETYWAISGKKLEELSVQEFISCAPSLGCSGGNTCQALAWLSIARHNQTRYRLVKNSEYPYEAKETLCKYDKTSQTGATVSGVCGCQSLVGHEHIMVQVVAQRGPLAVNVNSILWHDYAGGIIQRHCTNLTINHAVQIVGYSLLDPVPYWIVKNTWGPDFGEDGYLRIKIGENLCGLAEEPSFVYV